MCYVYVQIRKPVSNRTVEICILPLHKNPPFLCDATEELAKCVENVEGETLRNINQIHLLARVDRNGVLQTLMPTVADGLLNYKINTGMWVNTSM
jgi:hypothetical protein